MMITTTTADERRQCDSACQWPGRAATAVWLKHRQYPHIMRTPTFKLQMWYFSTYPHIYKYIHIKCAPPVLMLKFWLKKCALYVGIYGIWHRSAWWSGAAKKKHNNKWYINLSEQKLATDDGCDINWNMLALCLATAKLLAPLLCFLPVGFRPGTSNVKDNTKKCHQQTINRPRLSCHLWAS